MAYLGWVGGRVVFVSEAGRREGATKATGGGGGGRVKRWGRSLGTRKERGREREGQFDASQTRLSFRFARLTRACKEPHLSM